MPNWLAARFLSSFLTTDTDKKQVKSSTQGIITKAKLMGEGAKDIPARFLNF